jgi:hypothetical protein
MFLPGDILSVYHITHRYSSVFPLTVPEKAVIDATGSRIPMDTEYNRCQKRPLTEHR